MKLATIKLMVKCLMVKGAAQLETSDRFYDGGADKKADGATCPAEPELMCSNLSILPIDETADGFVGLCRNSGPELKQHGTNECYWRVNVYDKWILRFVFLKKVNELYDRCLWNNKKRQDYSMLVNRKIVFVIDNSASMGAKVSKGHIEKFGLAECNEATRHYEMLFTLMGMLNVLANVKDCNPDIILINPVVINGDKKYEFLEIFSSIYKFNEAITASALNPYGNTRSVSALHGVFLKYRPKQCEQYPHIVLFTDDEPNGSAECKYFNSIYGFKRLIEDYFVRQKGFTMSVVNCSDRNLEVGFLNSISGMSKNLSVTKHLITEYKMSSGNEQASRRALRKWIEFYIFKALVGPMGRDEMDGDKIRENALGRCKKDIEYYQKEIEELKAKIKVSQDQMQLKQLSKLLNESQRTLSCLLMKVEEYQE